MNISAVDNCNFNGLHYSVKYGVTPTKEQLRLKRLVEDKFNDSISSDNLIENLENIAGADVYITVGEEKGQDVVYLDARKRNFSIDTNLTKEEEYFYDSFAGKSKETLLARTSSNNANIKKINNFYNNCKKFVKSVLSTGEIIQ